MKKKNVVLVNKTIVTTIGTAAVFLILYYNISVTLLNKQQTITRKTIKTIINKQQLAIIINDNNRIMKLAIFDLDYTIWKPEMYQLNGPPRLISINEYQNKYNKKLTESTLREALTKDSQQILIDKSGSIMKMFDGARYALDDIQRLQKEGYPIQVAVASKTDEPNYAYICMNHMTLSDGITTIRDLISNDDLIEISYGTKVNHIKRLHQTTGISYNEMSFFDNENGNIQDVTNDKTTKNVKSFYTPNGMTQTLWIDALKIFHIV